ncbi:MAG: VOC family protein [Candidatus Hydrogenedentes bacterium]|nr:VOC family protein [Candidatus Hydrogenedentota bacterium]
MALRAVLSYVVLALAAGSALAVPGVDSVATIGMVVSDLDSAVDWYSRVLTFEKVSETEVAGEAYERLSGVFGLRMRIARMQLGSEQIELTQYLAPQGRPIPIDSRSNDRWFQHIAIIVSDMDKAYARLRGFKVAHASSGPQTLPGWNKNAGGISAFYFKDPDGHVLEVLNFPEGKGDGKWHVPTDKLFLGIDHTAIVVNDTEASLRFYRDVLGMKVAGESENYGVEQEHLNNVFGARLRITSLRSMSGPSIEFLEYLTPRDGRPYPADSRAPDLWQWQTTVTATDARAAAQAVRTTGHAWVSPGVIEIPKNSLDFSQGILVRDPDGHAIRIVQR